jgi:hypothetical protein
MNVQLPVERLRDLVCTQSIGWPAAAECCRELADRKSPVIPGRQVSASDIKRIYRRRLTRDPDIVEGGVRLLEDLEQYSGAVIVLAAVETHNRVFCLLLDEDATSLVSCFVGADRRFLP